MFQVTICPAGLSMKLAYSGVSPARSPRRAAAAATSRDSTHEGLSACVIASPTRCLWPAAVIHWVEGIAAPRRLEIAARPGWGGGRCRLLAGTFPPSLPPNRPPPPPHPHGPPPHTTPPPFFPAPSSPLPPPNP